MSITNIIEKYEQSKTLQISKEDKAKYIQEFKQSYQETMGNIQSELAKDIYKLSAKLIEPYQEQIPELQIKGIIQFALEETVKESALKYTITRAKGKDEKTAFEEAAKTLGEIVEAVIAKNIENTPLYQKIENKLKETYHTNGNNIEKQ
ncbi:hypothetical protein HY643_00295 [Candidatus Woesearchaeota archaeon]|nr:hypothetical protein [Candidatus Woesearchaeota archaeon]